MEWLSAARGRHGDALLDQAGEEPDGAGDGRGVEEQLGPAVDADLQVVAPVRGHPAEDLPGAHAQGQAPLTPVGGGQGPGQLAELGEGHRATGQGDAGRSEVVGVVKEHEGVGVERHAVALAGEGHVVEGAGEVLRRVEGVVPEVAERLRDPSGGGRERVALDDVGRRRAALDRVEHALDRCLVHHDPDPGIGSLEVADGVEDRRRGPVVGHHHPQGPGRLRFAVRAARRAQQEAGQHQRGP